jgi:hypothetical protein
MTATCATCAWHVNTNRPCAARVDTFGNTHVAVAGGPENGRVLGAREVRWVDNPSYPRRAPRDPETRPHVDQTVLVRVNRGSSTHVTPRVLRFQRPERAPGRRCEWYLGCLDAGLAAFLDVATDWLE